MASFGRLHGSLNSFTNENTAALINVNFDFSLFRCDAKPEFLPVGTALTVQRREEAESGPIHRTACTLGFLFSEVLPDTPALFKAYGQRVSEIIAQPNINPQGTASDGPFRSYIGADCTSIWAAATSSDASIAVHLLACLLARAFDSKTATSIWFEIVQERKQQVDKLVKDKKMIHPHTLMASKQIVSRLELAAWDTSARAWLRRADQAKAWEKHQFAIIIENIKLPYTAPGSTFSKVMITWTKSMEVLNDLLGNLPQQASDRAILLAISSWHLHPNLLVFQSKATNIDFGDKLFPPSAVLSLGLEYQQLTGSTNIRWSLALSHLRYYGDPVAVRSNEELSRVTMSQFWLVALGSLFKTWELRASEILDAIDWMDSLGDMISAAAGGEYVEIDWICSFCAAAKMFLEGDEGKRSASIQLVKFGWRRGTRLFGVSQGLQQPFFGLRNPYVVAALKEDDPINRGFTYLRGITSDPGFCSCDLLVSFRLLLGSDIYYEWATAFYDTNSQGRTREKPPNQRWIHFTNTTTVCDNYRIALEKRQRAIREIGEECHILSSYDSIPFVPRGKGMTSLITWPNPPEVLNGNGESFIQLREITFQESETKKRGFSIFAKEGAFDDYLFHTQSNKVDSSQGLGAVLKRAGAARAVVDYLRNIIDPSGPDTQPQGPKRKIFSDGLNPISAAVNGADHIHAANALMSRHNQLSWQFLKSIMVLQIAAILYEQLPGATISLRLIDIELHKASWLPDKFKEEGYRDKSYPHWITNTSAAGWFQEMTRAEGFGCIAMFESGRFNIKKEHLTDVLALCSEDSIFVAGIMLRDPSSVPPSGPQVRHLVGSIGQAGLVLLVSPLNPRIRPIGYDPSSVHHKEYDGKREDKFESVSLHLSFTEWKMPLDWENTGEIDQEVFLLESVLSVMHDGLWIGDIDVLSLERETLDVFETECKGDCEVHGADAHMHTRELISLDNWEEVLDPPPTGGVFRAKSNWAARLAVVSILCQQGNANSALVIGGTELCWKCLISHYESPEFHLPQLIID